MQNQEDSNEENKKETIILNADELRKMTKSAIKKKKSKNSKVVKFDEDVINNFLSKMEEDVVEFASKRGLYAVVWDYGAINVSIEYVREIAKIFKERHNGLMVIVNGGKRKIEVSWKPKQH